MIAKLISHGPPRGAALNALTRALEATEVAGLTTNLGFLAALTRHRGFASGEVDTGLIARDLAALPAEPPLPPEVAALAALAAAGLDAPRGWDRGLTLWTPLDHALALDHRGERLDAVLRCLGPEVVQVTLAGAEVRLHLGPAGWTADGIRAGHAVKSGAAITVFRAHAWTFRHLDPRDAATAEAGASLTLSPMPGLVKSVDVAAGQAVAKGDRLAVLEAMKMEHALTATRDGVVAEVLVAEGAQVEAGQPLIRLEEEAL
jgi:3-methylcrotonyl-CoA carboxylase alpha subunit